MNKVNWVIEKYIFEDYDQKLKDAILKSGHNVLFYDDVIYENLTEFFNKKFDCNIFPNPIIIFYGSFQNAKQMNKYTFYPGIYLTLPNYECFKYYGLFGDYLLNSNYFMMGLNDVLRNKDKIFNTFETDEIFIRPSDGFEKIKQQYLPTLKYKIGDKIWYVREILVKDTHEWRFNRLVKVRYEPELKYVAEEATINSINFEEPGYSISIENIERLLYFNHGIKLNSIASKEDAIRIAKEKTIADEKYREECSRLR